ncbi:unnamed protein product [Adineta steineri]|uniref:Uncharacterized protein n=1 Tax=Adineta steineri TaxID=433720 RepID=A0A819SP11_9BILA|nr:unnamed protein product [Adineta steineri]CAF1494688.1 unnamed protein product [Adineta steineri]CAF4073237.1 unnamed protein product [Adineta steineri]CAF4074247.1 unnamed protein product [Adineta steineri]
MINPDASTKSEITNDVSTMSIEHTLNPIDLNILINTFRSDAANEDIQKIIRQEMQVKDLPFSKQLEAMRSESQTAYLSTKFETNREQEQSKFIANSVNAWVDTALDSLNIVAHASAMTSLLGNALNKNGIQAIPSAAIDHGRSLLDRTISIYFRSIQQAVDGTHCLLGAIERNDNTKNNSTVNKAIENYKISYLRYKNDEIDVKEMAESHSQLIQKVEEAEPDETTEVRQEAKKSSNLWKVALLIGGIIAVPLVIVGGVLVVAMMSAKK